MNDEPHTEPRRIDRIAAVLNSPACLRGRALARRLAAADAEEGSHDQRVNDEIAGQLERLAEQAEGKA